MKPRRIFLIVLFVAVLHLAYCSHTTKESNIYAVFNAIFDGYKPEARPVTSSSTVSMVNVTFHTVSVQNVDEKMQTISLNLYLDFEWTDEHLQWNTSQYNGLDHLVVPQTAIWTPDVIVSPFAEKMEHLGYDRLPVVVNNEGRVSWQPSGLFTTHCDIDITYYPFDKQYCVLHLEMWASTISDTILALNYGNGSIVQNEQEKNLLDRNSEWQVLSAVQEESSVTTPIGATYSRLILNVALRRRPLFVSLTVVLPTILLGLLSTIVFALPAESGEKMSVSVTIFLTLVVSLSILLTVLPHCSLYVSIHVTYLALLTVFSALSVVCSFWVLNLRHRGACTWIENTREIGPGWTCFVLRVRRYRKSRWSLAVVLSRSRWNSKLKPVRSVCGEHTDCSAKASTSHSHSFAAASSTCPPTTLGFCPTENCNSRNAIQMSEVGLPDNKQQPITDDVTHRETAMNNACLSLNPHHLPRLSHVVAASGTAGRDDDAAHVPVDHLQRASTQGTATVARRLAEVDEYNHTLSRIHGSSDNLIRSPKETRRKGALSSERKHAAEILKAVENGKVTTHEACPWKSGRPDVRYRPSREVFNEAFNERLQNLHVGEAFNERLQNLHVGEVFNERLQNLHVGEAFKERLQNLHVGEVFNEMLQNVAGDCRGPEAGNEMVSWSEVAENLDFVLFRVFFVTVTAVTIFCCSILIQQHISHELAVEV